MIVYKRTVGACNCCGIVGEGYAVVCENAEEVHNYCLDCLKEISAHLQRKFDIYL